MRLRDALPAILSSFLLIGSARAATIWDEAINGDLSNAQATPTPVTLGAGTNSVFGTLRTSASTDFQDWIAVTVPAGLQLTQYVHVAYASTDNQGFTGFQAGSSFVGSTNSPGSYNGYAHYGPLATNGSINSGAPTSTIGVDLLTFMKNEAGVTGYTAPLQAGTYTFLVQQTGAAATSYQFNFNVAPVPEPATAGVLSLIATMLVSSRRRLGR